MHRQTIARLTAPERVDWGGGGTPAGRSREGGRRGRTAQGSQVPGAVLCTVPHMSSPTPPDTHSHGQTQVRPTRHVADPSQAPPPDTTPGKRGGCLYWMPPSNRRCTHTRTHKHTLGTAKQEQSKKSGWTNSSGAAEQPWTSFGRKKIDTQKQTNRRL